MENKRQIIIDETKGFWSEKVYILTNDLEIKGLVFMPKTGRKNRMLSDILNSPRKFVAVKNAEVTYKNYSNRKEYHDFIQLNLSSIIILCPHYE